MLSSRLNAFVMPTSQTRSIAGAPTWFDTRWTCFSFVASTFTRPDGTEALLIPCEEPLPPTGALRFARPWRSHPLSRVGAADDGLCRPAPLPRPVREPVSPRPAGEIQGLRARRALDARQS